MRDPMNPPQWVKDAMAGRVQTTRLNVRNPRQMDAYFDDLLVRAYEAEWGPRCDEYEPDCCVCQAWARFDGKDGALGGDR